MVPGHGPASQLLSRVSDQVVAPFHPEESAQNGAQASADEGED
jgi:hypothetical protein